MNAAASFLELTRRRSSGCAFEDTDAGAEEAIFESLVGLPAHARAPRLAHACRDDATLRARLESLLAAHDDARDFLEAPPADLAATASCRVLIDEEPGAQIGRYIVREKIGEGGCGVVYVAEPERPSGRRVALKVIKPGMDTRAVVARFAAEARALARMNHPNIARVLDVGATAAGRPFFAMELVRGLRITDYCDRNRLTTEQRLELFIQVCHAIQHAHERGIIHRDIKPSNVLVTLEPRATAKVIDFGIAKATQATLGEQTRFTATGQFLGTPAYVSPEQADCGGLEIDARSDLYSLGVLLYELLTGRPPFEARELTSLSLDEMRRRIREEDPPRPSVRVRTLDDADRTAAARQRRTAAERLTPRLRGDLDWIVMRCLEKDRARRYASAHALALDLERHLRRECVTARPPGIARALQKLLRRHRTALAAILLVALALSAGFALATALQRS